jgi:hypothetical protein
MDGVKIEKKLSKFQSTQSLGSSRATAAQIHPAYAGRYLLSTFPCL